MSFCDTFASLRARREFRLTSHRLRFFDWQDSCGWTFPVLSKNRIWILTIEMQLNHTPESPATTVAGRWFPFRNSSRLILPEVDLFRLGEVDFLVA